MVFVVADSVQELPLKSPALIEAGKSNIYMYMCGIKNIWEGSIFMDFAVSPDPWTSKHLKNYATQSFSDFDFLGQKC